MSDAISDLKKLGLYKLNQFKNSLGSGTGSSAIPMSSPFGAAPSGYGDMYDQLFAANPYRQQTYNRSFWENVGSALGFRTGYDNWLEQTSTQIGEYDAGIFSLMQQNEFNSEAAKAARMRQAGENPDLLGTNNVSDSASPSEDVNGMQPIAETVTGFGKSLLSAFSTGMQIYKGMADIKMITEQINQVAVNNADAMLDVVDKVIVGSVPLSVFTNKADALDNYLPTIDFTKYGFKGKSLDAANQMFLDRFDSIKNNADVREALYRRYNAISDVNKTAAGGLIPPSQMPGSPSVTNEIASPNDYFTLCIESMARTSRRIMELAQGNQLTEEEVVKPIQLGNEAAEAGIEADALSSMAEGDYGKMQGQAAVQSMAADLFNNNCKAIIAEEKARMYAELKEMSDNGSSFAQAMLYSMCLNDMMQFEISADAGLDFSLISGIAKLGKLFKGGKGAVKTLDEEAKKFSRSFGTGISFGARIKTK